jgi:hypothetical protein
MVRVLSSEGLMSKVFFTSNFQVLKALLVFPSFLLFKVTVAKVSKPSNTSSTVS